MQSSRTLQALPRLLSATLRLRLHNAGDYPTCQLVAAVLGRFTLRGRLCRLWSGASLAGMTGRGFRRSATAAETRR